MYSVEFEAFSFDNLPAVFNLDQDIMSFSFFYEEFKQIEEGSNQLLVDKSQSKSSSFQLSFFFISCAIFIASVASIFFLSNIMSGNQMMSRKELAEANLLKVVKLTEQADGSQISLNSNLKD